MCKLFVEADSKLWQSRARSLRIDGMVTSVRLENFFWNVLEELAERDGMNVVQLITRLHQESIEAGHDLGNFTSFLRVCCGRFLALQLSGDVPTDKTQSIASLNADKILETEASRVH
jgi:predicted DNA-binding ribbon-helix-helix protein